MTQEENTETNEKDKFFKNINNFLVQSGIVAIGIKTMTNSITSRVETVRKETEKKMISTGLMFFGVVLFIYGAVQVAAHFLDMTLYTNMVIGGLFIVGALITKYLK